MSKEFAIEDISLHSVLTWEQKYEESMIVEGILEHRKNFKLTTKELKYKVDQNFWNIDVFLH